MIRSEPISRSLALWLFSVCALVFAMLVVGAVTRLTESGLSMVEWRAATDMLPPLSQQAWLEEFRHYQATPEFLQKNAGMGLEAFKAIYFWEWLHRLLGRLTGLAYALPLAVFWLRGKIPAALRPRLLFFLFLGACQGFIGWYMVKSGLVHEPRVSHFRLAMHLSTALVLLACLWAQALTLLPRTAKAMRENYTGHLEKYRAHGWACLGIVCVTILWGAFVAGLDAGLVYNSFPLMGGRWVPGEILDFHPWWRNFVQNHAAVQFTHRILAACSFLTVLSFALRCEASRNYLLGRIGVVCAAAVSLQFALGIATLLTLVALPLAVLHQAQAAITLLCLVTALVFLHTQQKAFLPAA